MLFTVFVSILAAKPQNQFMKPKVFFALVTILYFNLPVSAQLRVGKASSEINFREGPGTNSQVLHSINSSNLLVVLPSEPQNGFVEAFDVETSKRGFVYETLIQITDTLFFQTQHFFEKLGENANGDVEIIITNKTNHLLFLWINKISYELSPYEKKVLVIDQEEITYFSSAPGLFPVFGKETLKKGESYVWNFTL
jgi:hypothetical protein